METNGNSVTKLMHLLVFHELHKMRVNKELDIQEILPEKNVLIEKKGCAKAGSFDFLVKTKEKKIGIEVLTRPSHGKLKEKLCYAKNVDEFVFVLPKDSLELYKKPVGKGHNCARLNFFSSEFKNQRIKAWLIDLAESKITIKTVFDKIFNVK